MKKIMILTLATLMMISTAAFGASWKVDPAHSAANFTIKHMAIAKVAGSFPAVEGELNLSEESDSPFTLALTIDAASIVTGVKQRDDHLKSADFFEVEKYPVITFISEKVNSIGNDKYQVAGKLTIHGVTKDATVEIDGLAGEAKDPWGNIRKGAQITTTINRKDFGLVYNAVLENGNLLIGEDAAVSVDLEFIKN